MIQSNYETGFDCGHQNATKYNIIEYQNCKISAILCDDCKTEYDKTRQKFQEVIQ